MCYHAIAIQDFSREMRLEIANNSLAKGLKRLFLLTDFHAQHSRDLFSILYVTRTQKLKGNSFFQYKNSGQKAVQKTAIQADLSQFGLIQNPIINNLGWNIWA